MAQMYVSVVLVVVVMVVVVAIMMMMLEEPTATNCRIEVNSASNMMAAERSGKLAERLKCDGTSAETSFRLSAKWMSPFKSAGASVHSTTGSRVVRISDSNVGYTMFRGSVESIDYPLHSPVSP